VCSKLGPWIAKRRAPKVAAKYAEIGGASPILEWTRKQGQLVVDLLNENRKQTAPHKFYVGFRYAHPLLEEALDQISR
jgi:ferrochelatase